MIDIIKKYIDSGYEIIPCNLDKTPFVKSTWNKHFGINDFVNAKAIGIKCGILNKGLECLDLDSHDGMAKQRLTEFIEKIKELYDKYKFPIEQTQNGGYHILWKCDFIEGNQKLASVPKKNEQGKWIPDAIFETRGDGGYFIAYPSPGYLLIKNDIFNIPTITKEERIYLLEIAKSFNTWTRIIPNEYEQTDKPGDIYNKTSDAIADMKNILSSHGWKELKHGEWTRPGKVKGISATLGKVAPNVFYVFSANAFPFDENSGYTPFQVMALLEYNGDFKACAKYLSDKLELKPHKIEPKTSQTEKTIDEKKEILRRSMIDTDIEIERPPVILYISDSNGTSTIRKRLLTLGNFSAIIGKAKSRKTFNLSMLSGCLVKNGNLYNKFYAQLPENKRCILYFDTEQGLYDSANVMKRIERLASQKPEHFLGFNLREHSPIERCDIIEYALSVFNEVGFVAIDGVADLANAINDEDEATRVVGLILRWTKQYNCHISTVIHQNKNDNFATGHLGSYIMKKAEAVISVSKEKGSQSHSVVSCDYSRGIDFDNYSFYIDDTGLPVLAEKIRDNEPIERWYE